MVRIVFFILILSGIGIQPVSAQPNHQGRIPEYPVPYTYPTPENIQEIIDRIYSYYRSTGSLGVTDSQTGKPITSFKKLNKNALPPDGFACEWSYTNGVVLSAFEYYDDVTGNATYLEYNTAFFDFVSETLPYFDAIKVKYNLHEKYGWGRMPNFHALDDCGSIGAAMIKTHLKNPNEDYLSIINLIAEYISNGQYRLEDGTLARHRPQYASVWADDMYMSVPFLANMGVLTGDTAYFTDAVTQVLQMAERLYIPQKELFDHGWNKTSADYDPRFYWGRANGWCLMAMAELLDVLPENYAGRDEILHLYRSMVRSLAGLQDGTGFWHNMLDKTNTYTETSATAMFTFAIAKGINEGWINHVYGPVALTGWNALTTRVLENGAVDGTCEGTTFAHDNTYYYHRGASVYATHGYGPVLYAATEMLRLLQNDNITVDKAKPNRVNSTYHYKLKSEWP